MKFGKIIGSLLFLNLGLVSCLVFVIVRSSGLPPGYAAIPVTNVVTATVYVTNLVSVSPTNRFHWREIESEDYRAYIQNLRQIGCPEQTIRDIIIADLDLLWAPRIRALYPALDQANFWESVEENLANNYDGQERNRQERAIDREKRDVVRELIETDLAGERSKLQGKEDSYERRLKFLPPDKRMDVRDLVDRHREEEWKILEKQWEEGAALSAEDRARLKELRESQSEALDSLLTPGERELYDLWMSPSADTVRHDFYGMEATEEEFRKVYALQSEFDLNWNRDLLDLEDPSIEALWTKAQSDLDAQVKLALGEERFADYRRGRDEDFHLLNAAVSRYGLDRDRAAAVYEMKQALARERQWVMSNAEFTQEQREAALAAMDRETQLAVKEALGENAYRYYRRRAGWLKMGK